MMVIVTLLVLAAAGLIRLNLTDRIAEYFDFEISLPVPGQGALGIECRVADHEVMNKLQTLDHTPTRFEIIAERAFLAELGGGCSMPIGALNQIRIPQQTHTLRLHNLA